MINKVYKSIKDYNDSGLSSTVGNQGNRLLNRDGSFNVEKRGVSFFENFSFFNVLITMSWWRFMAVVLAAYTFLNLFFATLYFGIGVENLAGATADTAAESFVEAIFFSAQTLTTVGYGRINPAGIAANLIASTEALIGLMCFALATGLLYGRFSRPVAKILWSDKAIISPYRDISAFMFRLANSKLNQLIDVEIQVMLSMLVHEGEVSARKVYNLELERRTINFLTLNWTVVHPISPLSPLTGLTRADLEQADAEFIISLKGTDETAMQSANARHSYKYFEIEWGAKFKGMFTRSEDGRATVLHLDRISDYEKI